MNKLTLYTKPGCHLCDEMKQVLNDLPGDIKIIIEEVNIETETSLREKYKYKIPVLILNGRVIAKYRTDRERLIRILK